MQPKICGGAENVVKTTSKHLNKWIARLHITLGIYTPLEACIVCVLTIIAWVAHRYGQLYLFLINILLGSLIVFA